MKDVVFVTGNQKKAEYLANLIGHPIEHVNVDLKEIQSLDLKEVVNHKLYQAYTKVNRPVLVEDVSLEFTALGRLPGTLIKWFLEELSAEGLCRLLDGKERTAIARCVFGYYDGHTETYFEGSMNGTIAEHPSGEKGYGWDSVFIPEGYSGTRAELSKEDDQKTYLRIKPIDNVRDFLNAD
ncbi:MAG: Ham1 family protein [Parcubacteria group bacterium]|nr:Ham1 family protein [Parcubacteria group bacterium]